MKSRLILALPLAIPLAISACTGGTRPCGTFDLPQAANWSTVESVGETATFSNSAGENLTLSLLSREDNAPFEGYSRSGSDSVVCEKHSQRRYVFGNSDAGLLIRITQWEGLNQPFEEQIFSIRTEPEAPPETQLGYNFWFSNSRFVFYREGEGSVLPNSTTRLLENNTFGSNRFEIAIEQRRSDVNNDMESAPAGLNLVNGIVIADGEDAALGGIVRIDFANGESFTRQD